MGHVFLDWQNITKNILEKAFFFLSVVFCKRRVRVQKLAQLKAKK
jgi:hypothetical protein